MGANAAARQHPVTAALIGQAARNAMICRSYKDGLQADQVARNYGISTSLVYRVTQAAGIPRHAVTQSVETRERLLPIVVAEYRAGATYRGLARKHKISQNVITKWLRMAGIPRETQRNVSPEVRKKISVAAKARFADPAVRARMREIATGRKMSDVARAKLSASHKGKTKSREHVRNLAAAVTGVSPEIYDAVQRGIIAMARHLGVDVRIIQKVARSRLITHADLPQPEPIVRPVAKPAARQVVGKAWPPAADVPCAGCGKAFVRTATRWHECAACEAADRA